MHGTLKRIKILCNRDENIKEKIKAFFSIPSASIFHTKYNFEFVHDYQYNPGTNTVSNYNYIKNKYEKKIKNFKELLNNNNKLILTVYQPLCTSKYKTLQIDDMMITLKEKYPNKIFFLIIFTDSKIIDSNLDNVYVEKLKLELLYHWFNTDNGSNKEINSKYQKIIEEIITKD